LARLPNRHFQQRSARLKVDQYFQIAVVVGATKHRTTHTRVRSTKVSDEFAECAPSQLRATDGLARVVSLREL